jgi:hypothetical protein
MTAHTIGTCYENPAMPGGNGEKFVTGEFTGCTVYEAGGSVLDLSDYFADEVRGGLIWDRLGEFSGIVIPTATTNAAATTKVMVKGVSWDDVVLAHDAACFNAAATSDNADVWLQPADSELLGIRTLLTAKFAGTGPLTALTIEVGDTGGTDANGFYDGSADLVANAVGSTSVGIGARIGVNDGTVNAYLATAAQRKLTATATGGDFDNTTAGSVTLRCYFTPSQTNGHVGRGSTPEVHTGQVLSGSTFYFQAWGTDA